MSIETIISEPQIILTLSLFVILVLIFFRGYKNTCARLDKHTILNSQNANLLIELKTEQELLTETNKNILETLEKVLASARQESGHQKYVREKLGEIRGEVIEQSLSKIKMDEGLRKLLSD
jgi:hypothetical protein